MRRWLTIALGGLVLSCQGPAVVMAQEATGAVAALVIPDVAKRRSGTDCVTGLGLPEIAARLSGRRTAATL